MEPENLTVKLLQEIRDSSKETRDELRHFADRTDRRFEQMDARFEQMDARFAVNETALRDLSQQLVMLARGIKTALEARAGVESRLDSAERRLDALEKAAD